MKKTGDIYPDAYFRREDEAADDLFYALPRKVVHFDAPAAAMLAALYAEILPPGGSYLDLMAGWRSHLPLDQLRPQRVTGLGLNAEEMLENGDLSEGEIWVHDLNREPHLPFASEEFDAVLCAASVQYLIHPLEVFAEVWRILKPGGCFVLSFSNRSFPTKATAVWLGTDDHQHLELVASYFIHSAAWEGLNARIKSVETGAPPAEDPLYIVWASKSPTDA